MTASVQPVDTGVNPTASLSRPEGVDSTTSLHARRGSSGTSQSSTSLQKPSRQPPSIVPSPTVSASSVRDSSNSGATAPTLLPHGAPFQQETLIVGLAIAGTLVLVLATSTLLLCRQRRRQRVFESVQWEPSQRGSWQAIEPFVANMHIEDGKRPLPDEQPRPRTTLSQARLRTAAARQK